MTLKIDWTCVIFSSYQPLELLGKSGNKTAVQEVDIQKYDF